MIAQSAVDVAKPSVCSLPRRSRRRNAKLLDGVSYRIAETRAEREAAFRLVYEAYVKKGLIPESSEQMRVTQWHLLPTTDVFIASHDGEVISTLSLVSDDQLGLPMESIFPAEVAELRESGQYLAEFSCLASRQDYFPRPQMFQVFVRLVSLVAQYARFNEIARVMIAVHPRHARFYSSFLGFERLGNEKAYPCVQDAPAVACQHDFELLDERRYKLYDQIYGVLFDRWQLLRQPMLAPDQEHFRRFAASTGDVPVVAA